MSELDGRRMNYTRESITSKLDDIVYGDTREANHRINLLKRSLMLLCLFVLLCLAALGFGMFKGIIDNTPALDSLSFGPTGFSSKTYDTSGNLVATLVQEGSNREEASFEELPKDLINAFVAIEDPRFWQHNGIDLKAITRAATGVITGNNLGGGSTLTQQLIKNNVFQGGMEDGFALYERKFQEWYLALLLENQPGVEKEEIKKEIVTDYLNTINLGNNTLGVKVAARRYFNKSLQELNLAECTVLASITKNPSRLNPLTHPEENNARRQKILENMLEQGYIDEAQYNEAKGMEVYSEIQTANAVTSEDTPYSFFTDALVNECLTVFKERLGMTEEQAKNLLYSGGLRIETTQDPRIQQIVDEEVNNPKNYDTAKYSFKWRYSLQRADGSKVNYSEHDIEDYVKNVKGRRYDGLFRTEDAVRETIEEFKATVTSETDEVLGETLDTTLQPQVSFVVMDQKTKEVKAISGGRGEKKYSLTMNRATDTKKQPGSAFKVIAAFAPAIEENGATLATTYYDAPYELGDKEFRNWWRKDEYFGYSTIRDGIEFSMNIVAVRCLMETVTPEEGVNFARSLGISTLTDQDYNAATALGGLTDGVTNLELTNAYATIADGGLYGKPKFFTKIYNHDGSVLIDLTEDEDERVMKETTAFLLTSAMEGVVTPHTKWASGYTVNNTSSRARLSNMTTAGKSGTTTKNVDVWFVGYTPYYTAGIWGGCDDNQSLNDSASGQYNGGTSFHKNIWKKIMDRVHEGLENVPFTQPDGIVEMQVCRKSGKLPTSGCRADYRAGKNAVYTEYFDADNVPTEYCDHHRKSGGMILPEGEEYKRTDDGGRGGGSSNREQMSTPEENSSGTVTETPPAAQGPGETQPEPQQPQTQPNVIYDERFSGPEVGPGVGL